MKPTKLSSHLLTIAIISFPIVVFAQGNEELQAVISTNQHFTELIGQLLPMAISPYLTVFTTCILSKLHIHTDFISTHPFYDSYIVMGLSFVLFLITLTPKFFSKLAAPITLTANFLDNKASIIIALIVTVLPSFIEPATTNNAQIVQMGFADIALPFQVVIMSAVAVAYLVVVMTVRLFLEILIMLSPVPLVDTVFEMAKIAFTIIMVLLGIFFPNFAFGVAILCFVISLFLYRRAKRTIVQIRYLIIRPVLHFIFRRKDELISEKIPNAITNQFSEISLAISVFNRKAVGDIPADKPVWLVKSSEGLFLVKRGAFGRLTKYEVPKFSSLQLTNNIMNLQLIDGEGLNLLISKSYLPKKSEIERILDCEIEMQTTHSNQKEKTGMKRWFSFFDISNLRSNRKMLLNKD